MSNLLFVTSSLFGADSRSRQLALEFIDALRDTTPDAAVVSRDLTPATMPHLDGEALGAVMTAPAERTKRQHELVAFADALIAELEAADTIVLAVPMYNFSIPSTLKAWIDHVARAGRTFRYTEAGAQGLLKGKKVFVVTARGGVYSEGPAGAFDFQEPYLRAVLGFIGLDDVTFLHLEGLKISPEAAASGLARARAALHGLAPHREAA
jgi:FMN-dependent NADH-azoreductase